MPSHRSISLVLAALSAYVASVRSQQQQQQCDVYLALSSASEEGDPKLGLYAGRPYEANARIGHHEIAVQVTDMDGHTGRTALTTTGKDGKGKKDNKPTNYFDLAAAMLWTSDSSGAKFESDESIGGPGQTFTAIPGVGMLGNFHAGIINADWDENATLFRTLMEDEAGGMGVVHPGRGAASEYYNVSIAATQTIPAGMEIFVNFGQDWSDKTLKDKDLATRKDYERADMQVDKMIEFFNKYEEELTPSLKSQLYSFLLNDVVALSSESQARANVAKSLLPAKPSKLQIFKDSGGALRHKNPEVFRDLDWLKENGRCLSNLKAGPSTIPHAGRGAFVTRTTKKGEVIAPVPLMQIGNRKELDMYELEKKKDSDGDYVYVRKGGSDAKPIGKQLLLNYCFGHPESNLLLYPFGAASNFVNHKSGSGANAKVVWSSPTGGMHHPEWLDLDPEVLSDDKHKHIGLMLDIVATRTIPEGGEVFIDYQDEWQKAWDNHVKKFNAATKASDVWAPTALELNSLYHKYEIGKGYTQPFKTPKEAEKDPYSERIATACATSFKDIPEDDPQKKIDGVKVYDWADSKEVWQGMSLRMCEVLDRIEFEEAGTGAKMFNYTVKVQLEEEMDSSTGKKVIRSVPHLAVRFVDRPYKNDQSRHEPFEPFRHHIGIPDEIFPAAWRNRKGGK